MTPGLDTAEVAAAAEDLIAQVKWLSGLVREPLAPRGGALLCLLPGDDHVLAKIAQIRLRPDEVEATVASARRRLRAQHRTRSSWWLGPNTTPSDLAERLGNLGLIHGEAVTATAALWAPPPGPKTVEVRRVRDESDAKAAARIIATCFELDRPTQSALVAALTEEIQPPVPDAVRNFLALIDGHPVATASLVYLDGAVGLIGGSTLPEARGLGCYRALVHARWQDATAADYYALVTQAVDTTSKPILERLGFSSLFPLAILRDTHVPEVPPGQATG